MQSKEMVSVKEFCIHHNIELPFIAQLTESGLIETELVGEESFLPISQLTRLEKIVRLHFELDINIEGVETIIHMLERMERMQKEISRLTNRLKAYEGPP